MLALLGKRTFLPAPKDGAPTRNHGHISYTNSNKLGLLHIYEAKLQTQRKYLFLRIMIFCNRLRSRVQHTQKETSFTSWYHILVFNFWFCASCKAKRKSVPNLRMSINESPIQHDDNSEKKPNLTQYVDFENYCLHSSNLSILSSYLFTHDCHCELYYSIYDKMAP